MDTFVLLFDNVYKNWCDALKLTITTGSIITPIALSCLELPWIALYCLVLPCIALYCLVLPCLALYCLVLPCLALYCLVLPCLALYCLVLFLFFLIFWNICYILYLIYRKVIGIIKINIKAKRNSLRTPNETLSEPQTKLSHNPIETQS